MVSTPDKTSLSTDSFDENVSFANYFLQAFFSVYYVDLETRVAKNYQLKDGVRKERILSDYYTKLVEHTLKNAHPSDKEDLIKAFSPDFIKEVIKKETSYSLIFTDIELKKTRKFRYQIMRAGDLNHAVICFIDVTKDFEAEYRYTNTMMSLSDNFQAIYDVDITTGYYDVYSENNVYADKITAQIIDKNEFFIDVVPNIRKVVYSEDHELLFEYVNIESFNKIVKQDSQVSFEYRLLVEGQPVWYRMKIRKSPHENNHILIGVFNVNEERIHEKENLIMAQSANLAKTTFLNNMSHDIRTPMNAIMGYTELALQHINEPEHISDYLKKIEESSEHLLNLINDVLDMSRIESGKMDKEEKDENILEIVRNLRDIMKANADQKNINLKAEICNIQNVDIICDKLRLKQILLNILSNAVKYTPSGGNVYMSVTQLPEEKKGYSTFEFYVKDTGIGMSNKFLETIYEPFTRMQSSTVSGIQGTGLGMTITKSLVDMMGGKISVKSELKKGTEVSCIFTFKLQNKKKKAAKENRSEKENSVPKKILEGKKILLVEDNEFNREIAVEILETQNIIVTTACDGVEAVEKMTAAKAGDYDLVLMDIQMPVMNGYDATRKIRELGTEISKIPILAMTANAFEEDKKLALDAGMNDHISKPINIPLLIKIIEQYL